MNKTELKKRILFDARLQKLQSLEKALLKMAELLKDGWKLSDIVIVHKEWFPKLEDKGKTYLCFTKKV